MPTYEYACTSCGDHLEVVQSFSDEPLTACPNCGSPLRKVFGSIGIVLKGSGFYKTDNRRSGSSGASSTKPSEPAASAKAESSSSSTSSTPSGDKSTSSSTAGNGTSSTATKAATSS